MPEPKTPVRFGRDVRLDAHMMTEQMYHQYVLQGGFDCGESEQNDYIREKARHDTLTTMIFVDRQTREMIAYCSFRCSGIMTLPENPPDNDVMIADEFTLCSAMEIRSLALDRRYQHMPFDEANEKLTLGGLILSHVLDHLGSVASNQIGAQYIILYAVPRRKSFYQRYGFESFTAEMRRDQDSYLRGCTAMYMPIPQGI